jgi:hypothetical protein
MTFGGSCPCFLVKRSFQEHFFEKRFSSERMMFDIMFFPESINGNYVMISSFMMGKKPRTEVAFRDIAEPAEEIIKSNEMVSMERPVMVRWPSDGTGDMERFMWKGRRI